MYIPGNLIVDGTVTATAMDADEIFSKGYEVSSSGSIYSTGKSWYEAPTAGFFIGKSWSGS